MNAFAASHGWTSNLKGTTLKTKLNLLTAVAIGFAASQSFASSSDQVYTVQQSPMAWQVAASGPVWVGSWNCKSRNSGAIQRVIAAANGDYTVSTDEYRFDGEWATVSKNEYYYLIPYVVEGWITVKPTANGFTAIGATDTYDCTPGT